MFIPMLYDNTGKVTDVQGFKRISFTLNRNVEKLLEGSVTFEEQTKSADPTVKANTTNSKKTSTSTAKKGTTKTTLKPKEKMVVKTGQFVEGKIEDVGIKMAVIAGALWGVE